MDGRLFSRMSLVVCVAIVSCLTFAACDEGEDEHDCPPPPEVQVCNLAQFARQTGVDVTDIGFEPGDVLYRHAAQLNLIAFKNAEREYRRANPTCPYPGVRLVQTIDAPPCPRRQDFTDDQMTGLRVALELHQSVPLWWELLPDCPCTEDLIPPGWEGGPADPDYHPGAANCYRSPPLTQDVLVGAGLDPSLRPGQQCCYDINNRLITSGPGAGTPDLQSPSSQFVGHQYLDVETFNILGWQLYNIYWPPNTDECPDNPSQGE